MESSGRIRFDWQLPLCAAVVTIVLCFLDALADSDGLLYLLMAAVVSLLCFVLLLVAAIAKKLRLCVAVLSMLLVFWAASFVMIKNHYAIRNAARWSLWSRRYQAEVLAQPELTNGEFKHMEWDSWGFAGAGDTNVYLVFDPANSLAMAARSHQPGKFNGIPCKVPLVSRLENGWYAIRFYTDERWGRAHSDCGTAE
jgi:hypothetical protein